MKCIVFMFLGMANRRVAPPQGIMLFDMIRQYQKLETHPFLRLEFSLIEGEEEFIPYLSQQKLPREKSGMER